MKVVSQARLKCGLLSVSCTGEVSESNLHCGWLDLACETRSIDVHSSRGLGRRRSLGKVPLRVELEDEGTKWVVGRSSETVDSSPSTESLDSWAAAPSVDFSLS